MNYQYFNQDDMALLADSYYGEGGYKNGRYLVKGTLETDDKFLQRKQLLQNDNYFRMIHNAGITPIFDGVRRDVDGGTLLDLVDDADSLGTSWASAMRSAALDADLFGCEICFFDTPSNQPQDLLSAREMQTYPYLIRLNPLQIVDYMLNGENELVFMTYISSYDGSVPIYSVYQDGVYYEARKDKNGSYVRLGEVIEALHEPQILTFEKYREPYYLPSSGYLATAEQQKAIFNVLSLINYQALQTSFSIGHTDDSRLEDKDFKLGEHSILKTRQGTSFDWKQIPNTMDRLEERLEKTRDAMFSQHNLGVLNTSANASGKSREYADLLRIQRLKYKAQIMQEYETRLLNIFNEIVGENQEFSVSYPDEFTVGNLTEYIEDRSALLDMGISQENSAMVRADTISKAYPNKSAEERQAILDSEIANKDYDSDGDDLTGYNDGP